MQGSLQPVLAGMRDELISLREKVDQQQEILECLEDQFCNSTEEQYTCGGTGGWRRAVYLDMTDPNTNCPPGWQLTGLSPRTCGRLSTGAGSCDSVTFPVSGGAYREVCGKIVGYQYGQTSAFWGQPSTVDSQYFTGVAVMHGSPREHIWTFAAGLAENWPVSNVFLCPCDANFAASVPPFIGNDYFCESGYDLSVGGGLYDLKDPLWDGAGCSSSSTCCSLNNPPTFIKSLSAPTTDDLELRLCCYRDSSQMNVPVELVELYVK